MNNNIKTDYKIRIAGLERALPLLEIEPGISIAILNILGDTELVEAAAGALAEKLASTPCDVLITAEAKSIPLAHALSVAMGKPYVVLRKEYKTYMGDALSAHTVSITTGKPRTLYLDAKDKTRLDGAHVIIVDDVISTGSTLEGLRKVVRQAGGQIIAEAAIATEGDQQRWQDIVSLGHLPVFKSETP